MRKTTAIWLLIHPKSNNTKKYKKTLDFWSHYAIIASITTRRSSQRPSHAKEIKYGVGHEQNEGENG
jgi:hypothetical protein